MQSDPKASTHTNGHAGQPLKVDQVAELLGLTPAAVREQCERGIITSVRHGKSWLCWLSYEGLYSAAKLQSAARQREHQAKLDAAAAQRKQAQNSPTAQQLRERILELEGRIAELPAKAAVLQEEAKSALVAHELERATLLENQAAQVLSLEKALLLEDLSRRKDALARLERTPTEIAEELTERRGRVAAELAGLASQIRNASWGSPQGPGPESCAYRRAERLRAVLREIDAELVGLGQTATAPAKSKREEHAAPGRIPAL